MSHITQEQAHAMGAKGAPAIEAERLLFESWVTEHGLHPRRPDLKDAAGYHYEHTQHEWRVWQAALAQPELVSSATQWVMTAPDGTTFSGDTPLRAANHASKYRLEIDPVAAKKFLDIVERERKLGEEEHDRCMKEYGTLDCPACGGSGHIGDVVQSKLVELGGEVLANLINKHFYPGMTANYEHYRAFSKAVLVAAAKGGAL